jgi:DNA sulfur modification protein DndB
MGTLVAEDAAAIVDGQHRLGGLVCMLERYGLARDLDFLLLPDLTLAEEIQEFVVTNSSQVGVKRSLTTFLSRDDNPDAWVAWELNERSDSPFAGRIARQRLEAGQLFTLEAVSTGVQRTFSSGAFAAVAPADRLAMLIEYWSIICRNHPEEWVDIEKPRRTHFEYKLLETTGLIAWSLAATALLAPSFDAANGVVDWDRVEKRIAYLSGQIDWRKRGEFAGWTGEAGGALIRNAMERSIARFDARHCS